MIEPSVLATFTLVLGAAYSLHLVKTLCETVREVIINSKVFQGPLKLVLAGSSLVKFPGIFQVCLSISDSSVDFGSIKLVVYVLQ